MEVEDTARRHRRDGEARQLDGTILRQDAMTMARGDTMMVLEGGMMIVGEGMEADLLERGTIRTDRGAGRGVGARRGASRVGAGVGRRLDVVVGGEGGIVRLEVGKGGTARLEVGGGGDGVRAIRAIQANHAVEVGVADGMDGDRVWIEGLDGGCWYFERSGRRTAV